MLRIETGKASGPYCDGLSRRSFVQLGVTGMAAAGLGDVLRAQALSAEGKAPDDRAAILLWLDGGPSHMDLYDMKPDAPVEYRGIWNPIKTNVPGIEITEMFPRQAKVADKFAVLRSLHHDTGDHFGGSHRMLTTKGGVSGPIEKRSSRESAPSSPGRRGRVTATCRLTSACRMRRVWACGPAISAAIFWARHTIPSKPEEIPIRRISRCVTLTFPPH